MATRVPRLARLITPALATRVDSVPEGDEWFHERKLDGYRVQCHAGGKTATLITRNGLDWSERFPAIVAAILKVAPGKEMIVDGEVVMPSRGSHSSFQALQGAVRAGSTARAVYWVFDLLRYDGLDLRQLSFSERRNALSKALSQSAQNGRVRMTQELRGPPAKLLSNACTKGEEGVISKRRDSPYSGGRSRDWLKIKCAQQDEFVIVGYTAPRGSREHLGALLLATRVPGNQDLRYVGRVGSGFSVDVLRELRARVAPRTSPPVELAISTGLPRCVQWVEPELIANVSFAEWTADGLLRQATFGGLREDKSVATVEREIVQSVRGIALSHGDRIVFPENGVRKRDIATYYDAVAPLMLPHLAGRPLSLLRCPDGAQAACFFQKHWSAAQGKGITTRLVREADGTSDPYAVAATADELLALVQMNVIEIHAWGSSFPVLERPDRIILDFDPGPGVSWVAICDATRRARALLASIGLESWVKLSGGKGLHVTIPVTGAVTWDQLSMFSKLIATRMAHDEPRLFTSTVTKSARNKRIFIDWMRNARGATAAAPWTVRARPGAPVAMPLLWDELEDISRGDLMTIPDVIDYLRSSPPDPWHDLLRKTQRITSAMVTSLGNGMP